MYEIGVIAHFEAAHRLVGDFGPATRLHGHTYRLEVTLRGERLQPDGTLYDIGRLRAEVDALAAALHYRELETVPGLVGVNTTAEAVASYCWEALAGNLGGKGLASLRVAVWESHEGFAVRDEVVR
ncbi:MAG TPA: 6-carboxytetrahydropterin synthase [Ktedonobacterales bacterium]